MPTAKTLLDLPSDPEALKALLSSLLLEREEQRQRADELAQQAEQQQQRAAAESSLRQSLELKVEQLQHELDLLKKRYYGPRADRLRNMAELGQMLLAFSEELAAKPVDAGDVEANAKPAEPERELRWVRRRRGRRNLASFENLPVQTIVHELSAEERVCNCCGIERQEIGAEVSWQIEYTPAHFERIEHVRKKYACSHCDHEGYGAQIAVAEKPASPIEKGMAGPGLLAYIVTSKFADFLPLYRLENIFERIGCEISRSTQSVWCGDVADLILPLYERMAARVRQSHVILTDDTPMPMQEPGRGKTRRARMWVYLGDESQPYNVFHFTESRKRDGPVEFLRDYKEVLVADAYGGYDGVVAGNAIRRGGCHAHARRKFVDAEKTMPEIAWEAAQFYRALYKIERDAATLDAASRLSLPSGALAASARELARAAACVARDSAAEEPDGRGGELQSEPVAGADAVSGRRRGADRQQRFRAGDETRSSKSEELVVRGQCSRRTDGCHSVELHCDLPAARNRSATLPHPIASEPSHVADERP